MRNFLGMALLSVVVINTLMIPFLRWFLSLSASTQFTSVNIACFVVGAALLWWSWRDDNA